MSARTPRSNWNAIGIRAAAIVAIATLLAAFIMKPSAEKPVAPGSQTVTQIASPVMTQTFKPTIINQSPEVKIIVREGLSPGQFDKLISSLTERRKPLNANVPHAELPVVMHSSCSEKIVKPGDNFTLTISYANVGASTIDNMKFSMTLPAGYACISMSDGGIFDQNSRKLLWNLYSLKPASISAVSTDLQAAPDVKVAQTYTVSVPITFKDKAGNPIATYYSPATITSTRYVTQRSATYGNLITEPLPHQ